VFVREGQPGLVLGAAYAENCLYYTGLFEM
jgi:hypothetical protein